MVPLAPMLVAAAAHGPAPAIDVYTMGQGDDLFERFGHAAICVVPATAERATHCYNYGTTDFGSPPEQLGWRFVRGSASFWVSVWPLPRMLQSYRARDRDVWRQRLPLSDEQARRMAARLAHDALPENRTYRYHHLYDNCSTRVRDVVNEATDGSLSSESDRSLGTSFRDLGRSMLAGERLALLASDVWIGRGVDRDVSAWAGMFLPHLLRAELEARFDAVPERVVTRRGPAFSSAAGHDAPWIVGPGAALAAASLIAARRRAERALRGITGVVLGGLALAVWTMVAVSAIAELRINELALVLWPTDLALGALSLPASRRYARVRVVALSLAALAASVGLLRQPLWPFLALAGLPMLALTRKMRETETPRDTR